MSSDETLTLCELTEIHARLSRLLITFMQEERLSLSKLARLIDANKELGKVIRELQKKVAEDE